MMFSKRFAPIFIAAGLATVLCGIPAGAQNSGADARVIRIAANPDSAPRQVSLSLNKAAIIELDRDARDVVVANPAIVDAVVRTPKRIFILALKVGQTNAIFLDAQGRHMATVEIAVGADVNDLNSSMLRHMPESRIKAAALNDNIVLDGTVGSAQEASAAQELAVRFAGAPEKVVNMMKVEQRQQVLIKVRVSEMSRSIAKQLGVNMSSVLGVNGVPVIASTGNQFSLLGRALSDLSGTQIGQVCRVTNFQDSVIDGLTGQLPTSVFPNQSANALGIVPGNNMNMPGTSLGFSPNSLCEGTPNNVQSVIQALERIGLVRTLAEPNLTAISGEPAKFLAGGEFPVPSGRDSSGNVSIEFKPFGVGLAFTPVVLSKGRISLQISTEVSELTNTGAFVLQGGTTTVNGQTTATAGLTIPALSVRRAETTVELPSGGSLAIGGLLQQTTKQSLDALPGLKDLPILGGLFRSRDFQNNETELVVTVTAYLVDPVSEQQLVRPDDGYVVPTDLEATLLGRLNAVYGKDAKKPVAQVGSSGYIVQ